MSEIEQEWWYLAAFFGAYVGAPAVVLPAFGGRMSERSRNSLKVIVIPPPVDGSAYWRARLVSPRRHRRDEPRTEACLPEAR